LTTVSTSRGVDFAAKTFNQLGAPFFGLTNANVRRQIFSPMAAAMASSMRSTGFAQKLTPIHKHLRQQQLIACRFGRLA
jgi:hypothetical protein